MLRSKPIHLRAQLLSKTATFLELVIEALRLSTLQSL